MLTIQISHSQNEQDKITNIKKKKNFPNNINQRFSKNTQNLQILFEKTDEVNMI